MCFPSVCTSLQPFLTRLGAVKLSKLLLLDTLQFIWLSVNFDPEIRGFTIIYYSVANVNIPEIYFRRIALIARYTEPFQTVNITG